MRHVTASGPWELQTIHQHCDLKQQSHHQEAQKCKKCGLRWTKKNAIYSTGTETRGRASVTLFDGQACGVTFDLSASWTPPVPLAPEWAHPQHTFNLWLIQ